MAHRARLPRQAAAGNRDDEIVLGDAVGDDERLAQHHAQHRTGEINLNRAVIDGDLAGARLDPDAGDRVLALAGGVSAAVFVELLHINGMHGLDALARWRAGGRGLEVLQRGKRGLGHVQALRVFLEFRAAMSSDTGL